LRDVQSLKNRIHFYSFRWLIINIFIFIHLFPNIC
jgi:hypothetical protein